MKKICWTPRDSQVPLMSKAFYKLCHIVLVKSLFSFGVPTQLCIWIKSFLSDRLVIVVVDGQSSIFHSVNDLFSWPHGGTHFHLASSPVKMWGLFWIRKYCSFINLYLLNFLKLCRSGISLSYMEASIP